MGEDYWVDVCYSRPDDTCGEITDGDWELKEFTVAAKYYYIKKLVTNGSYNHLLSVVKQKRK